jgi:ankyrin repeat protein
MMLRALALLILLAQPAAAQRSPSPGEARAYDGLFAAVYDGDTALVARLVAEGADLTRRDAAGRTVAHVAAFRSFDDILALLAEAGADLNALEHQAYDVVTIAAVADDPDLLRVALAHGASAANVTSPYDGTALIAAAHLGNFEVVEILAAAGAPLDHVNNLNWTALLEAVILGDGGYFHQQTLRALLDAGADPSIADAGGETPLDHARQRGYSEMVDMLRNR